MGKKRPLQNDPHSKGDKKRKKDEQKIEVNAQEDNETALSELWEKSSVATTIRVEEDFPRGGEEVVTPLERRRLRHQAQQDILFGKSSVEDDDEEEDIANTSTKKGKKQIIEDIESSYKTMKVLDYLSSKHLVEGLLVLAAVREIQSYRLVMSLPFNMTGSVNIGDISDPLANLAQQQVDQDEQRDEDKPLTELSRLFHVGQILPCFVLDVDTKRRHVQLTINPRLVNSHIIAKNLRPNMVLSGCVQSIEDHGYIIDFGISKRNGFLLKKNASEFTKLHCEGKHLHIGQVMSCCTLSGVDARSVPISINPTIVYSSLLLSESFLPLSSLLPGLLVNASVKQVTPTALVVNYLGGFEGTVHFRHLSNKEFSTDKFPVNKKLKARILWVDVLNKKAGLTLQREIVTGIGHQFKGMEIGDIFHDVRIVHVDSRNGVILELGNGAFGYAPMKFIYDEKTEKVQKRHSVGSHHSCRIVQFNLIDGFVIVSLQDSVLEKPFMKISDVKPGAVVEGEIVKLTERGVFIRLSDHFDGFCPDAQLADAKVKRARTKLAEGDKVKCRVLTVNLSDRFILLTRKKSLVSSELPPLTDKASAKPGDVHDGEIIVIQDHGILVRFYNHVVGFVPKMELSSSSTQIILDPQSSFKTGQIVRCIVLKNDIENNKLTLSLRVDHPTLTTPTNDSSLVENNVRAGEMIDLEITGVANNGISLRHPTTSELVFLPLDLLSDYPIHCSELLSFYGRMLAEGTENGETYILKDVLILSTRLPSHPAIGTLKKALIQAVKDNSYPNSFSELKVGMIFPGVIKRSFSYGCFVEFPNGLTGLSPIRFLSDEFLSEATGVYRDMQTVFAKVQEINMEKERFLLSLRSSDLRVFLIHSSENAQDMLMQHFLSFLQERDQLLLNDSLSSSKDIPIHQPGTLVSAEITSVSNDVLHLLLDDDVVAKAYVSMATEEGLSEGDHVTCCILDVDINTGQYWVTLNSKLVSVNDGRKDKTRKLKKKSKRISQYQTQFKVQAGHSVSLTVEHVTPYYLICTASSLVGSTIAYGLFDSWGVIPSQLKYLKPGYRTTGTVISSSSLYLGTTTGPPIVILGESGDFAKQLKVAIGDIIEVIVSEILDNQINVSYGSWKGRVHATMVTDDMTEGSFPLSRYQNGDTIRAKLLKFRQNNPRLAIRPGSVHLELTTKESLLDDNTLTEDSIDEILNMKTNIGDKIIGVVREVTSSNLLVGVTPYVNVIIPALLTPEGCSQHIKKLKSHYRVGQVISCTLGESRIVGDTKRKWSHQYMGSLLGTPPTLSVGTTVEGKIVKILSQGLRVELPFPLPGIVDVTNISDHFFANPLQYFKIGESYSFHILEIAATKVVLSLRHSHLGETPQCLPKIAQESQPDREILCIEDLKKGEILRGYVKAVSSVGVFIKLGHNVVGRVMIANISDRFIQNYQSSVNEEELVRTKVLSIDKEKGQVELSLKLSDIDPAAAEKERQREETWKKTKKERVRRKLMRVSSSEDSSSEDEEDSAELENVMESMEEDVETVEDNVMIVDTEEPKPKKRKETKASTKKSKKKKEKVLEEESLPTLPVQGGFNWNVTTYSSLLTQSSDSEMDDQEEEEMISGKKTRRHKKAAKKAEELRLYKKEHELLDTSRIPESADDFDRMLVANPNSSALWLQYMAFYLHTAEVDKARTIAERGLTTISFREEQEKLNLWVGLMNLENLYGTHESLMKVFQRAIQQNEPLSVYYKLADIYVNSKKLDLADQLYNTITKKFSNQVQVWTRYGLYLMEHGRVDVARGLIQRSLKSLTKKQHIDVISKFAQYEFKYGEIERGCTMFESLLSCYPRRVDLWSVYLDMMIKKGQTDRVREIFERAINLKVSVKKMKFLFKRYMEFEKVYGSPAQMATVRDKAKAYVNTRTGSLESI